jgi:hypothetical protein
MAAMAPGARFDGPCLCRTPEREAQDFSGRSLIRAHNASNPVPIMVSKYRSGLRRIYRASVGLRDPSVTARGPFADKVSALIADSHRLPDMGAADRQDAVEMTSFEAAGNVTVCAAPAPIMTYTAPERIAAEAARRGDHDSTVAGYLIATVAGHLGLAFDDVERVVLDIPPEHQWNLLCPLGWSNIVDHVSRALLGEQVSIRITPAIH